MQSNDEIQTQIRMALIASGYFGGDSAGGLAIAQVTVGRDVLYNLCRVVLGHLTKAITWQSGASALIMTSLIFTPAVVAPSNWELVVELLA